jgi:hypothetical protein
LLDHLKRFLRLSVALFGKLRYVAQSFLPIARLHSSAPATATSYQHRHSESESSQSASLASLAEEIASARFQ